MLNHIMKKIYSLVSLVLILNTICFGQDDLEKMLEQNKPAEKQLTVATFKSTRLINLPTIETLGKRSLDFRIAHRFGELNGGGYNFYGLDGGASIRLSLEYSYDGRLMFGLGRTSIQKMYDGFVKYRLLRQTTDNSMPLSVTLVSTMNLTTIKDPNKSAIVPDKYEKLSSRLSYVHQLIIGRKFNESFSVQVSPTLIHYNMVDLQSDLNDIYAIGFAGRYKVTRSLAITGEYAYRLNKYSKNFNHYYNTAGIGFDLETGGHVFQIHFTNSVGINEAQLIPYTQTRWLNGGFRLGFNISRVFTL